MDESKKYWDEKHNEKNDELRDQFEGFKAHILMNYTKRELQMILNCMMYAENEPAGLPGHNTMILTAKLALEAGIDGQVIRYALDQVTTEQLIKEWWDAKPDDEFLREL